MKPHGERIRAEQLQRLLDGALPADHAPAELTRLAAVATAVREEIRLPTPDPAFRRELRARLLTAPAWQPAAPRPGERLRRWLEDLRQSARVAVASGLASLMIGTTGVAVASQQALPGDLLYPVKQATESVRMALASGEDARGRLHLRFAGERLEEVEEGADDLPADRLIATLGEMDRHSLEGTNALLSVVAEEGAGDRLDVLRSFADDQRRGLAAVRDQVPAVVSPFVERSLEVLRRIEARVQRAAGQCGHCPGDGGVRLGAVRLPGRVVAPGEGPAVVEEDPCRCPPIQAAPPTRIDPDPSPDPAPPATGEPSPPPSPAEPDQDDADPGERVIVPELPDPLDPVGEDLDRAVRDLLELTGTEPPKAPDLPPPEAPEPPQDPDLPLPDGSDPLP